MVIRDVVRQSSFVLALYCAGRILSFLTSAYVLPWAMEAEVLGLYSGVQSLGYILARFDIGASVVRYFVRLEDNTKKKAAFFTGVLLTTTLVYLLAIAPFFIGREFIVGFFSKRAVEMVGYLPLIMVLGYVIVLNVTIKAFCIALKRIIYPNFLQHIVLRIFLNFHVLGYAWGIFSFHTFLLGLIVPYALNLVLLVGYLVHLGEFSMGWDLRCLGRRFMYSFVGYSLFMIVGVNLIFMLTRIDTVMILGMCSKGEAGVYRVIASVALLLNVPVKALSQATFASIARMIAREAYDELCVLYKALTLYQCFFSCLVFSLMYTALPYVFYALPQGFLTRGRYVFIMLAMGEVVYNMFSTSHAILVFSRYFRFNVLTFILLLLGVVANYVMIGTWGMLGASSATCLILISAGACTCALVWYKLGMHPFSLELFVVLGGTVVGVLLQGWVSLASDMWLDRVLWMVVSAVWYGALLFLYRRYALNGVVGVL